VLWAARWEHDKNPETFFAALERLESLGVDFQIDVIGESYRRMPEVFQASRARWPDRIGRWGFQDRAGYAAALREADAFVSTANHEFFGIAAVEAMTAGAYPLLPRRLAYPELLELAERPVMSQFFYDGSAEQLAGRLQEVSRLRGDPNQWRTAIDLVRSAVARFAWPTAVERMDAALQLAALHRAAASVDSAHGTN
jgi:glycosyltransferase involved in cell wall biosynthesis